MPATKWSGKRVEVIETWPPGGLPSPLNNEASLTNGLRGSVPRPPNTLLRACVLSAASRCGTANAGLSLRRAGAGQRRLRALKLQINARRVSQHALAACVRSGTLILATAGVGSGRVETLLSPIVSGDRPEVLGVLWVSRRKQQGSFSDEDARVLHELAAFATAALMTERATQVLNAERLAASELAHRSENALHMAAHLLGQQASATEDAAARTAIETARGRILAVGGMHRLLEKDVDADLESVVTAVFEALLTGDARFAFTVNQDRPLLVPSAQAALVVLIVNELVTNAIKHAPARPVTIRARIAQELDAVEVSIGDDGDPYPPEAAAKTGRQGLRLTEGLARQLGGRITIDRAQKRTTLRFPLTTGSPVPRRQVSLAAPW